MFDETSSLHAVRVVEWSHGSSGAYCAKLLADAGADVIKVEPPQGDELRRTIYSSANGEERIRQGLFQFLNTNKRSITLNLHRAKGRALLNSLLQTATIFVWESSYSIGRKLRLHYRSLRKANPQLVVTSITPFGLTGPYREFTADEFTTYNAGGLGFTTPGPPDYVENADKEPPLHPNAPISDVVSGMTAAAATMMALLASDMDGEGRHVDISGMEAMAATTVWDMGAYSHGQVIRGRVLDTMALAPNAVMRCKDGWIALACPYEHFWQRLVNVMGNPDWASLEVFEDRYHRAIYWDALKPLLEEWTTQYTGEELLTMGQESGLPVFPAYSVGDMIQSQQMRDRKFFWDVPVEGGMTKVPGPLFHLSKTPLTLRGTAPDLGGHNDSVYKQELGMSAREMESLRKDGVI